MTTCSEKWVVAHRVGLELANIHPRPPAVRLFDAGVGDGTVLSRVMRSMHDRFPAMPFYVVGKEISLEDIRLTLQKVADRFVEHPATVLVLTNLAYADAPWLAVKSVSAASSLVWHEVPLTGTTAHKFEAQITDLEPFLAENWKAGLSPKTGNPVYERPVVMVIYRDDHKFLLDQILPKPGGTQASYDLVIASQPYRARASLEFKSKRVIAPLARALGPGGRLIAIHSHGADPGLEIIQRLWPGDNPFIHDRHQIMKAVKNELGPAGRELNFNVYADNRALFRYDMHTLPSEISDSIGTSTLFAAWNAAIYVAQVEDDRLAAIHGEPPLSRCHPRRAAPARRAVVLRRVLRDLATPRLEAPMTAALTLRPRPPQLRAEPHPHRRLRRAASFEVTRLAPGDLDALRALPERPRVYVSAVLTRPVRAAARRRHGARRGGVRAGPASCGAELRERRRARCPSRAARGNRRAPPPRHRRRSRGAGGPIPCRDRGDRERPAAGPRHRRDRHRRLSRRPSAGHHRGPRPRACGEARSCGADRARRPHRDAVGFLGPFDRRVDPAAARPRRRADACASASPAR